jgi:hypothetical protein
VPHHATPSQDAVLHVNVGRPVPSHAARMTHSRATFESEAFGLTDPPRKSPLASGSRGLSQRAGRRQK